MLKINDVELELDLMDGDTAEKYENAIDKLNSKAQEKHEKETLSQSIKRQCNLVFDFFNEVFGEGTDKKLFGNKTNLRECTEAFKQVIDYTEEQHKELEKDLLKYSPNRATRRSKK